LEKGKEKKRRGGEEEEKSQSRSDFHVLRGRRFFFGWAAPKKNEKNSAFLCATAS